MSYFLAFAGFAALIILHEFGHFTAAKAVGMRVERFALFFPPLIFKVRRGETEYGIGVIPLGGYVRITGMNPNEVIPPEVEDRAYYRQPVWKRIIVITAGPAMNVLIAFVILFGLFAIKGERDIAVTHRIEAVNKRAPAAGLLRPGDVLVAVDGHRGGPTRLARLIARHRCSGEPLPGCPATTPARLTVLRKGQLRTFAIRPRYDPRAGKPLVGFQFDATQIYHTVGLGTAAHDSVKAMWHVTTATVSAIARLFYSEKARKQVSGVVGSYEATRQSFEFDTPQALIVLAIISLSLAIINLFPFLPLDGGHIFWALAEKLRGRAIPFAVMERASVFGFMLVLFLFVVGLTNDIDRLRGEGFNVR